MRIDILLFRLRLAKSRSAAQQLIEAGHCRCNGGRVIKPSHLIELPAVLTYPAGQIVRVIEILALPARRGPAQEAQACYRALDPERQSDIAASAVQSREGKPLP